MGERNAGTEHRSEWEEVGEEWSGEADVEGDEDAGGGE